MSYVVANGQAVATDDLSRDGTVEKLQLTRLSDLNGTPLFAVANGAIAAAAGPASLKASAGRLFGVTVTSVGTAPLTLTDGAGGAVLMAIQANEPLGFLPTAPNGLQFSNLYVNSGAGTPGVTVHYA